MDNQNMRYAQMERLMTLTLIGNLILFVLYMIFAGAGVIWLKVILAILMIIINILCLVFLYMSQELTKPRSMWMTTAAVCMLLCQILSLILNYPN